MRLGERLVAGGAITAEQLTMPSIIRKITVVPGEALVKLGYTTQKVIEQNMLVLNPRIPIGELLVQNGEITPNNCKSARFPKKAADAGR